MINALIALAVFLVLLKIYTKLSTGRCISPTCLVGKTALVTGGNSGIGFETALGLAARGCRVIIAARHNLEEAKNEIVRKTGNPNIVTNYLDLGSLKSVRKLAKDVKGAEERLDILINNAGAADLESAYTEDGLLLETQVNHFGPFLLTHLLIGLVKKSSPSRIIFVSSEAASLLFQRTLIFPENVPNSWVTKWSIYANSKLCNIITANEMAKRLKGTGVTVNSLYPGIIYTPISIGLLRLPLNWANALFCFVVEHFVRLYFKTAEEGAQTTLHLAMAKELDGVTGKFFRDCQITRMPFYAKNLAYSRKVWEASEKLVKLEPGEKLT